MLSLVCRMGFWHIFVSDLFLLRLCGFEECCFSGSYNKSARFQEENHEALKEFKEIAASYYPDFATRAYPKGHFDETCMDAVPLSFHIITLSTSFEDAIRLAISHGGDSDTIGAIVGSIAEARFGIPQEIKDKVKSYLPEDMKQVFRQFEDARKS